MYKYIYLFIFVGRVDFQDTKHKIKTQTKSDYNIINNINNINNNNRNQPQTCHLCRPGGLPGRVGIVPSQRIRYARRRGARQVSQVVSMVYLV